MAWLAENLNIKPQEVMAFGDSENDETMLKWAKNSYALANGNERAIKAAKFKTERTNNEGGVGFTILENLTNIEK